MNLLTQCAAWWAGLLAVAWAGSCAAHAQVQGDEPVSSLLAAVLGVEINVTREYVDQLEAKASILRKLLAIEQQRRINLSHHEQKQNGSNSIPRSRLPQTRERFEDWLTPQPVWHISDPVTAVNDQSLPSNLHVEMISFKASGYSAAKRSAQANRGAGFDPATPLLQLIVVLNKQSGLLEVLHPVTQELLWQHRLVLPSRVTSFHFHSDRAAHILLTTAGGELLVYKIRVFHGRRLAAGDFRRQTGRELLWCPYVTGYSSTLPSQWWQLSPQLSTYSLPSGGLYYHVEIDHVFSRAPSIQPKIAAMVAMQHTLTIVTADDAGRIEFIDGHNGSTIGQVSGSFGRVAQFHSLSYGIVAFAAGNTIRFLDTIDKRVLPLTCVGSRHNITHLTRDAWRQSVLFASTEGGYGLAFQIHRFSSLKFGNGHNVEHHEGLGNDEPSMPSCSISALLQSRSRALECAGDSARHGAMVVALPGYMVLATGDGHLVLYETATSPPGQPAFLAETRFSALRDSTSTRLVSMDAARDFVPGSPIAMTLTFLNSEARRFTVERFVSHAPTATNSMDIGWIRAPMMLLCGVGVMFWQQKRVRPSSSSISDMDFTSSRHIRDFMRSSESANQRGRRAF